MGRIEVIAGCMYSGKTEELIRRLIRARIAKQSVIVFKPAIDTRYAVEEVVTHAGMSFPCFPLQSAQEILSGAQEAHVVGIDEAQFFDAALPDIVEQLAASGKRVVIAGLDLDSDGQPFGPMPHLMALAEEVVKPTAVCTTCGGNATRTQRMVRNWERVLLGSTGAYDARCRTHWRPGPEE
jgi:thymidine kinase